MTYGQALRKYFFAVVHLHSAYECVLKIKSIKFFRILLH